MGKLRHQLKSHESPHIRRRTYDPLRPFLYGFGIWGTLGSILFFRNSEYGDTHILWQIMYLFILVGTILIGMRSKKNAVVVSGIFFTIVYIMSLALQYFPDPLAGGLSLIVTGLFLVTLARQSTFFLPQGKPHTSNETLVKKPIATASALNRELSKPPQETIR